MYYSNINDNEVRAFHEKIKLTASYTELKALDTDLFDESNPNKCIPMFYYDEITGNENVRILDNKLILYTDDDDLDSVYFTGKLENLTFDVTSRRVGSPFNYLILHFYDTISLFSLAGFHFHIKQNSTQHTYGINLDVVSDDYGNINIPLKAYHGTDTFTIICKETGQEKVIS